MRKTALKDNIAPVEINTKTDLRNEMLKCYQCDCETYPLCTADGGPCSECFDLKNYEHKQPNVDNPGTYLSTGRKTKEDKTRVTYPYIQMLETPGDGDCLYSTLSLAFGGKITSEDLRYLVSTKQNEERFSSYKELATYMPEFRLVKSCKTLRQFKNLMQVNGKDVGYKHCLWGDENSLGIICNAYHIGALIFDPKGQLIQHIQPDNTRAKRFILMQFFTSKSGQTHYNLLVFNNHGLLTSTELKGFQDAIRNRSNRRKRN